MSRIAAISLLLLGSGLYFGFFFWMGKMFTRIENSYKSKLDFMEKINQCDGCQRKLPFVKEFNPVNGIDYVYHKDDRGHVMGCTKDRYVSPPGVPEWINKFLVAGSQNNCGDLSIMVSTVSAIIQEVREATLEEAADVVEKMTKETTGNSNHQCEWCTWWQDCTCSNPLSSAQSTIRSLKTK